MVCTRSSLLVVAISLIILNSVCADYGKARDKSIKVNGKDMTKKSIVFDKSTPDVFYCIPNKPTGEDKIIVRYGRIPFTWFSIRCFHEDRPGRIFLYLLIPLGYLELSHCINYANSRGTHYQKTTSLTATKTLTNRTMRAKRNTE